MEVAWPFGEDGCQQQCRAAGTTRTPRASTYSASTTFGRNPTPLLPFKCSATLFREVCSGNRVAEHYHGSIGAGLRPRVVETKYVEALGVLVVSAARHRSWQPSSPNAAALTTSPPHHFREPICKKFRGFPEKNCPTGTKFPERGKWDFKSNFRLSENFVPAGHFFPDNSSNRAAEVGCGGEVVGGGPFGEDGDAARQRPPGHPGLQHTSIRPPSDATPPRY